MKYITQVRNFGAGAALLAVASQSHAAVDPAVTTAISTGVSDGAVIGGLVLAFVIGIAVFRHLRGAK